LKNPDDVEESTLKRCEQYVDSLTLKIAEWRRVRSLVSEATWVNYSIQEITGLREQRMLGEQAKIIRDAWKNRPGILKGKNDVSKKQKRLKEED